MQVDCGSDHSILVDNGGRVFAFGSNKHGQLGIGSFNDEFQPQVIGRLHDRVTQAACGTDHTLLLTGSGQVYSFGNNSHGQLGISNTYHSV